VDKMTKQQQIWLAVFLAMFLVPEVLWGPIFNAITSLFGWPLHSIYFNLTTFNDYPYLAFLVILVEIISIAGLWYLNLKVNHQNNLRGLFISILLAIIDIVLVFLLFLNFAMSGISFP